LAAEWAAECLVQERLLQVVERGELALVDRFEALRLLGKALSFSTRTFCTEILSYEVDQVAVTEIARQEGRPVATIYTRLRRARQDLATALSREAAIAAGPLVRRNTGTAKKPRT
jgi:DNA-directed RNA polymerase specialized sigma24 family protein